MGSSVCHGDAQDIVVEDRPVYHDSIQRTDEICGAEYRRGIMPISGEKPEP
jgi:hypothetical protein